MMDNDEELEKLKADSRKVIDEWIDGMPEDTRDQLRAFNWNLQQRVDNAGSPTEQMNVILAVLDERFTEFENAVERIMPKRFENNVVPFPSTVDPNEEK